MRLKQRARFGQVMWCAFSDDAPLPEFRGEHPALVVQSAKDLKDTCVVVPITSSRHNPSPSVYKLTKSYNPAAPNLEAWVICDHIYTVSQERLRPFQHRGYQAVPRIHQDDLEGVVAAIRQGFPKIFTEVKEPTKVVVEETIVVAESLEILPEKD